MKKFSIIFCLVLFLSIQSFAIPKDPCEPKDVCCEEPPAGPFAFSYPKDVGLACPRDFYAHAEFLLMKGSEEGLDYAMDQDHTGSGAFPLEVGKVRGFSSESQEWDWRPGFRVGFGFFTNHDSWNFDANWTYFRIKADSEQENIAEALLGLYLPPLSSTQVLNLQRASARWSGDFNTLDLMIGKPYHVSRCYISNPMFGVRAAWIDQDYHIRYFMNTFNFKQNVFAKNDYWAVGLRGYYEGNFLIGSGWFLYGKAAFALLFGKFDTSQHSDIDPISGFKYKTEDSFYCVQPNAELGMGISWSKFFHKNQYKVAVKVGYEFHHWWDQNQMRKFFNPDPVANDTVSRGDLSFNGFMIGLNVDI